MSTRTTLTLAFVAVSGFLCEGLYDPLTTEFFIQELGWTAEQFAVKQGTWGMAGEMVGALSGGFLASRFASRSVALGGFVMIMAVLLTFSLTSVGWSSPEYPHVVLLPLFRGCVAFTTVSLFAVYMKACWTAAAATQFTLYMALNNIGYSLGAKLNSWLPSLGISMDYAQSYLLGGLLPGAALLLLLTVPVQSAPRAVECGNTIVDAA